MKSLNRILSMAIAAACMTLISINMFAQGGRVSGSVKDGKDQPVVGAVVMLEGNTSIATVTDLDGNYTISIPSSAKEPKLKITCLSYKDLVVAVAKRSRVDVVLEDDSEQLEEVVVVGYGSMRKSDLTGAVASVKIDEDEAAKSTSLDQMLMGHAAGVDVVAANESPDAGVSIRIRGITSLNGSSEPLYVVDGVILTTAGSGNTTIDEDEEVNSLMGINPQDIASLEILKDASATAIYGAAGANGVVLITTKQATKDRPTINFNAGYDISTPYKLVDVLSFDGWAEYLQYRANYPGESGLGLTTLKRIYTGGVIAPENLKVNRKDWQHEYISNAPRQRYYLSVSGRPKNLSYTMSMGYNRTEGVVANTSSEQFTTRMNVDKTFNKKLKVGMKTNFAFIRSRQMQGAGSGDNGVSSSFMKSLTTYHPYLNKGTLDDEEDEYDPDDTNVQSSPALWARSSYQTRAEFRVTPNAYAQYKILPWLSARSSFGADYHRQERAKFKGLGVSKAPAAGASTYGETYSWNWDNTLNANKSFGKHTLTGTAGFTLNRYYNNVQTITSSDVVQFGLGLGTINSANEASLSFSETQTSKMSFFARAIYNYSDRYVLTATYRLDGSSLFAQGKRFAGFPSLAAAWRLNQEPWFNVDVISMAKLRFGWGRVGNCSVSPYQYMATYGSGSMGNHFNDAGYVATITPGVFSNKELIWETTEQYNAGLDFSMWEGRLSLTVDAYYKNTFDLLQKRNVTYNTGFGTVWVNQGTIENKGLEFSLELAPVVTDNFEWTVSGNLSFNRNKLTEIGFDVNPAVFYFEPGKPTYQYYYTGASISSSQYLSSAAINVFMLGQPLGLLYGYKTDGIVKEGQYGIAVNKDEYESGKFKQPGSVNYVDMNGNGYLDIEDRTIIGNANPDFSYGFSTAFSFWNFRLSANFQGVYGNDIYNANRMMLSDTHLDATLKNVYTDAMAKAWTIENPYTNYVATSASALYGVDFPSVFNSIEKSYATDRDVEDGSYLRCSSLALSYTLNLPKAWPVRRMVFGMSVNNLFILTSYSGFSPMVNSYKLSSQRIGIDSGGYPASRSYCFDIKFTF